MIYALYKGDSFISVGTLEEIAEETGKTLSQLKWMLAPSYRKRCTSGKNRLELILIEE